MSARKSGPYCAVKSCKKYACEHEDVSFFRFPKNEER